ncbi:MAG: metallophosphoesterase [Actinobacteria bacterium]|nr:metallophosphoesterase [Actinomycetota bacterium]
MLRKAVDLEVLARLEVHADLHGQPCVPLEQLVCRHDSRTIVALRVCIVLALLVVPSARGATSILAIGDFGVGGERQRVLGTAVRDYESRRSADLLLTLGDNDYTRGVSFATNWTSTFGWLSAARVGVAGTLGNHDVEFARGRYQFDLLRMPGAYYVRRAKDVELIVLDSNAITTAQTRWLTRTLAKRSPRTRIVALHHPPYTCGGHLGSGAVQRVWVPLFERYGVRLVLSGHDHNYQRFERNGVTYVVHGGGGAGLYKLRACPRAYPARLAARVGHGFLHLAVEPDGVLVQVIDLKGQSIDRFRVT